MLPLFEWFQDLLLPSSYSGSYARHTRLATTVLGHLGRSLQLSMVLAHLSSVTIGLVSWIGELVGSKEVVLPGTDATEGDRISETPSPKRENTRATPAPCCPPSETKETQADAEERQEDSVERLSVARIAAGVVQDLSAKIILLVCLAAVFTSIKTIYGLDLVPDAGGLSYWTLPGLTKIHADPSLNATKKEQWLDEYKASFQQQVVYLRIRNVTVMNLLDKSPYDEMVFWEFSTRGYDENHDYDLTPAACLMHKGDSVTEWATNGRCTSTLVFDNRYPPKSRTAISYPLKSRRAISHLFKRYGKQPL